MISKYIQLKTPLVQLTKSLCQTRYHCFASEAKTEDTKASNEVLAQQLGVKDPKAKDEQYQEECFKFEREWKKISQEKDAKQMEELNKELTEHQKKKVELLVNATLQLNMFELRYYSGIIKERVARSTGMNPMKLNMDWPSIKQMDDGTWPATNPNWFNQQDAMAKLWPMGMQGFAQLFGGMVGTGGGSAGAAAGGQVAAGGTEEKKEEPAKAAKRDKTNYDIELTGIDAAQKIKIIKEIRALLTLGLKEAKELVESAPVTIKKEVKKEDAEALKEKLTTMGCTITLL
jgi:large subunit ribosomal protein L7/L12